VQREGLERTVDSAKLHARVRALVSDENLPEAGKAKLKWFPQGWDNQSDD
jgi:hypothetical protein